MKAFTTSVLITVLMAVSAQASVIVRGGYAMSNGAAEGFNGVVNDGCTGGCGSPMKGTSGYGADIIYMFGKSPVGLGVRYESFATSLSVNPTNATFPSGYRYGFTRVGLLGTWRFVNSNKYLGLIGSYGLSNSSKISVVPSSGANTELTAAKVASYSAGFEGGWKFKKMQVGLEVAYGRLNANEYKTAAGAAFPVAGDALDNLSLSGMYANLMIGIEI